MQISCLYLNYFIIKVLQWYRATISDFQSHVVQNNNTNEWTIIRKLILTQSHLPLPTHLVYVGTIFITKLTAWKAVVLIILK